MRKLFFLFILFHAFCANGQNKCSVTIVGDTCTGSMLVARTSEPPDALIWYKDTVPVTLRESRGYYSDVTRVAGGLQYMRDVANLCMDKQGNIYISDPLLCKVWKWKQGADTGTVVAGFGGCGSDSDELRSPNGIAVDSRGNLYVAEEGNNIVSKWASGSRTKTVFANTGCTNLFIDKEDDLYISDESKDRVLKWPPGATQGILVAGGNGGGSALNQLAGPSSICVDDSGNVFVGDYWNFRVVKWPPGAKEGILVAGGNGSGNSIYQFSPIDVFVDKRNRLFVSSFGFKIMMWPKGSTYGITVAGEHGDEILQNKISSGKFVIDSSGFMYALDTVVHKVAPSFIIDSTYVTPYNEERYMGTYSVKAIYKNGCEATSPPVFVSRQPESGSITGQEGNVCGALVLDYTDVGAERATYYLWDNPKETTILSGQGTKTITISTTKKFSSGPLRVTTSNSCGSSYVRTFHLYGHPIIPPHISGPSSVKAGQKNINYYLIDSQANVYYDWIVPSGSTITSGQGTNIIFVDWGNNPGNIAVTLSNKCGFAKKNRLKYVRITSSPFQNNSLASYPELNYRGLTNAVIYPQPVYSTATIEFNSEKFVGYTMALSNMQGKVLLRSKKFATAGKNKETIDLSSLTAGTYFITLRIEAGEIKNLKLIKN